MQDETDLAALVGSRICHDLISPIGAISNGVELLLMDGASDSPELALISESVASANARIRFFRIAFGSASGDQRIAKHEVQSVLADMTKGSRLSIGWTSPSDLARPEVRLAFLLLQCLESAMPYGGRIEVTQTEKDWSVVGEAERLKVEAPLWDGLKVSAQPSEIAAGKVQFALVPGELHRQGRKLTVELRSTSIRLTF